MFDYPEILFSSSALGNNVCDSCVGCSDLSLGFISSVISDDVERENNYDEADSEPLCRTGKERVIGTRLVLGKEGIRAAGYNTDALLVTLLKNDNNYQYYGSDKKQNS